MRSHFGSFPTLFALLATIGMIQSSQIRADDSGGFGQIFDNFFGTEGARSRAATCDEDEQHDSGAGLLGAVNGFFCHMEKDMGITGTTPSGGVTKQFAKYGISVHAEVNGSAGGGAYSGYDYEAKVWACATVSGSCGSASGFRRALYINWSYKADKSVNKGIMYQDNAVFSGSSGNAFYLTWDVGSSTATKTVTAKVLQSGMATEATATKSNTVMSIALVMVNGGSNYRFGAAVDTSQNLASAYFEAPGGMGSASVSASATGDAKTGTCFSRTRSGDDWTYSPASGCGALASLTMAPDSVNTIAAWTASSLLNWNSSISVNPSAI